MRLLGFRAICLFFAVGSILALPQNRADAASTDFGIDNVLLARAMAFADLNNWAEAEPLFRLAEEKSRQGGNKRDYNFARLGLIRSTAQQRTLPQTLRDLERMRAVEPLVRSDKRLYLFYLGIKAEIDGEMRSSAARQDWEAVAQVARDLGNFKWENRSLAGVGMAAFYAGDLTTARQNISAALVSATQNHDVGSQVQYLYAVGNGLAATQLDAQALSYFDKAISLALATPNAGYPFMVNLARCAALVRLGQVVEAKKAVFGLLETAQRRHTPVYEAATLAALADIDHSHGDLAKAASNLEHSVEICRRGGFVRNLVDAQLSLADVYAEQRKWPKAEQVLVEAVDGAQSNGDLSTLPERLRIVAGIQVAQGKFASAERTYQKASTFVDAMIAADAAVVDKTAWIRIASRLYVEHFALAAEHGTDPAHAFSILEQVRGRAFTDFLLGGSTTSKRARETETAISKARFQLVGAKTNADISKVRDRLFLLEQSRWINPDVSVLKAKLNSRIELSRLQSAMSRQAVILEFVLAEPKSFCLAITRDSAQVLSLAPKSQIELLVDSFLSAVKSRQPGTQEARRLYDVLLSPLTSFIEKEDILVVRDGVLHRLPFDALVSSAGDFVGSNHVVSYLPSGTSFYLLAQLSSLVTTGPL